MENVFVDTDIVLDLLYKRKPFYDHSARLFSLADQQKDQLKLFISSLYIANINYILSRQFSNREVRKIIIRFKVLVAVLPVDDKIIELALASDFNDLEDAIQYYTAIEHHINILLTRNLKDYKKALIPVMTAEDYINSRD